LDGGEEAAEVDGFGDEVYFGSEALGVVEAELAGDEDDFDVGEAVVEVEGEGVAGKAGEADVEQGDVGGKFVNGVFGFFGGPAGIDSMSKTPQEIGERLTGYSIILDK
jgi:hypothetical protein